MLNLAVIARQGAKHFTDELALLGSDRLGSDLLGSDRLSYGELDEAARRVAAGLMGRGIARGAHVALMIPNVSSFAIAYYGCHYAGLPVVPLNVMLKADEIAYHLEDSDAAALIVHESLLEPALDAVARVATCRQLIVADGTGPESLMALMDVQPVSDLPDTRADDTAVLLYTSGTTGRAKGAELTHFNLFYNAELASRLHGTTERTVALAVLPLFHSFGQTVIMNGTLLRGGSVVMLPRFEPLAVLEAIERQRVTFFAGVPTMYFALLHHPEAGRFDLSSLCECASGGAPMPVEVMRAFDQRHQVDILEGYGLSETSPVASLNMRDRPKKPGSIGRPIWGVEFRLLDDAGQAIDDASVPGEIWIKGHNVMKGYYKRPEATREALIDGWLRTGDIAVRDDDGYYFIVDRKKDLILRGGFNVYPREVEEVLYAHPAVGEAAVIGVADERLGEEVKAVVALKPGAAATPDELVAWCRERMAAYKHPRTVELVDALPKGPTGKILKRALR